MMKEQETTQILYAFTLHSHFQREREKGETHALPGEKAWQYARTHQQLQRLMNMLDPTAFPAEDRESDGLILCIDPHKNQAYSDVQDGILQQSLEIPQAAIVSTIPVPRQAIHYLVPEGLDIPGQRPELREQIRHVLGAFPKIALAALLIGITTALFPDQLGKIVTSDWLNYFLRVGKAWEITILVGVFCAGVFYWLVVLSRLEIKLVGTDSELISFVQNILNIPRRFDPGTQNARNLYLFVCGLLLIMLSLGGASLWENTQPEPTILFQIRLKGEEPFVLSEGQQLEISQDSAIEVRVDLPPIIAQPTCRWNTSSRESSIYQQSGCQAVYWSRNITNEDRIQVEIFEHGKLLKSASLTIKIVSTE